MVIQRWQSVFLLIGAIAAALIPFMPWATVGEQLIDLSDNIVAMTINLLSAVLFILAIFMYRNLRRQKSITLIGTLLLVINNVSAVCLTYTGEPSGTMVWTGGFMLFIIAIICGCMAYQRISADDKLLKSADRLR